MSSNIVRDTGFIDKLDKLWGWITKVQSVIDESEFSFLNFSLGDHNVGDIAMFIVNVLFSIITAVVGVFIIALLSQYFFRWLYNKYRSLLGGSIVWSEVVYEGIVSDNESANSAAQMDNVSSLMKNTSSGSILGFQFTRPRYIVMIRLNPDDEQAHMYIGVNKKTMMKAISLLGQANLTAL